MNEIPAKRLQIDECGDHLRIRVSLADFTIGKVVLTVNGLIGCLLFAALAISLAFSSEQGTATGSVVCVVLILVVLYVLGSFWLNTTTLDVSPDKLRVKTRPFPTLQTPKAVTLDVAEIRQLFVHTYEHLGNEGQTLGFSYSLNALLRNGRNVVVVDFYKASCWQSSDQALEIEERIEEFLGIDDIPVESDVTPVFDCIVSIKNEP